MKNLPEELILEILLRLPVKSLLRFKSVCKAWLSLISKPQFATSHFDLAAAQTERIFFLTVNEVQSVDFEKSLHDDSALEKLKFPLVPSFPYVKIIGSCRGFLLLDDDDYLVVLGSHRMDPNREFITNHFEIFSFRTNSRRTIEGTDFPYFDDPDQPRVGLHFSGALHWLALRHDILEDVIMAVDLIEEKPRDFSMPRGFYGSLYHQDLAVLEGCLGLCAKDGDTTCVWIMKECGVRSSWIKSVVLYLATATHYYISPICSTKGGEIVGQDSSLELVKFNYRGELLELRSYNDIPHWCKAAVYTESLLSLPSGSEEGVEDLQQS